MWAGIGLPDATDPGWIARCKHCAYTSEVGDHGTVSKLAEDHAASSGHQVIIKKEGE